MTDEGRARRPEVRHRVYWGVFLATWTLLALIIRWHVRGLDIEVRREGLSNAAVVACRNVLVDHIDVETGLRGHLVSGRREFLRPYFEGLGRIDLDMAALRAAVGPIPEERATYDGIAETSKSLLGEFANQVAVVENDGVESGRRRFDAFPTKASMDKVRAQLLSIQSSEDARLARAMRSLEISMATTIFLIDAFTFVLVVLLIAMATGFLTPPSPVPREGGVA